MHRLITIEEYNNPSEECNVHREAAAQWIDEVEQILFGPRQPQHIDLGSDPIAYRICVRIYGRLLDDLVDAAIPHNLKFESLEYCRLEVNKVYTSKLDEILVKYD